MAKPKSSLINDDELRALMRMQPALSDVAAFYQCTIKTIERYIKDNFKMSFLEFRDANMVHTKMRLIRKAIQKAEDGDNIMLIFCLKNLCGWANETVIRDQRVGFKTDDDDE